MGAVRDAASRLDRRAMLVASLDSIAVKIDDPETPARDLAALTRRLVDISGQIEAIDLQRKQSGGAAAEVPEDEPFDGKDF